MTPRHGAPQLARERHRGERTPQAVRVDAEGVADAPEAERERAVLGEEPCERIAPPPSHARVAGCLPPQAGDRIRIERHGRIDELALLLGVAGMFDLRLLGFSPKIPLATLRSLFPAIRWAFLLNFITGVLLFMADASHKATQLVFLIKLTLIAVALLNLGALSRWLAGAEAATSSIDPSARRLAGLSLLLWTGTIVAGRLMAYL